MKDDLISRQLAINAIEKKAYRHTYLDQIIDIVSELPSAQPEPCEYAVSAMAVEEMLKDLLPERGMWEIEGDEAKTAICETVHDALDGLWRLPFVKPDSKELSFTQKAPDTISRQMAIDAFEDTTYTKNEIRRRITELPSAQPKPCEDCVSRKSVIRLLHSGYHNKSMIEEVKELPSVQPEPVRINLNELIKVKLTDWGKEIYYHQYDRTNQIAGREICKPKFPKEDENGYTEFQLWCFIELYGEHMGMTLPNVIEPIEIVYERRTG